VVNNMAEDTILYISDHGPCSDFISAALDATGHNVVSIHSSAQAIAMLFVMHSVAAVVLGQQWIEQPSFDLTRNLRALCPDVQLVALCDGRIDQLPLEVDCCVNTRQPLETLTSDLKRIIEERPIAVGPIDCCSSALAVTEQ
jgi:hypothetical protein